jgi:hypothetical protein
MSISLASYGTIVDMPQMESEKGLSEKESLVFSFKKKFRCN